ncbi:MAG: Fic family protein [Candidatus Endonucleobacter sp. (ex Gigantidas childressi)]|nr:Fic family protein [Candidatus Endonucleobacter sp. (ex Gigantidas childressi)]
MTKKTLMLSTLLTVCLNTNSILKVEAQIIKDTGFRIATLNMLDIISDNISMHSTQYSKECMIKYMNAIKEFPIDDVIETYNYDRKIGKFADLKPLTSDAIVMKLCEIAQESNNIDKNLQQVQLVLDKNDITRSFPAKMLYKLFIDEEDWKLNGEIYTYENELGYASSLLRAWCKMEDILSEGPINFQKIKELHRICTHNVLKENGTKLLPSPEYHDQHKCITITARLGRNCTIKGTTEVLLLAQAANMTNIFAYNNVYDADGKPIPSKIRPELYRQLDENNRVKDEDEDEDEGNYVSMFKVKHVFINNETSEDIIKVVEGYCGNYETSLQKTRSNTMLTKQQKQDKIIEATSELCRNVSFTHPFVDGNSRTECIVLNGLLLKQGLSPAIIPDINVFEGYDIETLVEIVKTGQKTYQQYRKR